MHGGDILTHPGISIIFLCASIFLLYLVFKNWKISNSIKELGNIKVLDTSYKWIYFTGFIGLVAIGIHLLAEYTLHWYDVTLIDKFTHGISGMAITAIVLNFNLTRKRKYYYSIAIAVSFIAFVLWEVFEFLFVHFNPDGFIEISNWDTAVDLWIDLLGGLTICFLCDELIE